MIDIDAQVMTPYDSILSLILLLFILTNSSAYFSMNA